MNNPDNNLFEGLRVLIIQQRGWAWRIGHFLAKQLQADGCELAALTIKRSVHEYALKQTDVKYQMIVNYDDVLSDPYQYLGNDEYSLEEICKDLCVDSIWPMVYSVRNLVKSYKDKYYYGFKQNVTDEFIVTYVKAVYKYVKLFYNEFKPDIILAPNFVELEHIFFVLLAKKHGATMIVPLDSKIRGINIFTHYYDDSRGSLIDRINELNSGNVKSENVAKAKKYISEFRIRFKHPESMDSFYKKTKLLKKLRQELSPWRQIVNWFIKKPLTFHKGIGVTVDYRPPQYILRDHFAHKRHKKFANNFSYDIFHEIKKFAYFPLQFQPEATVDTSSPYHSNQIEMARLTAMCLPDDYTLVVKDHPAMAGYRNPSYLEKVARTPNVKLIDYRIPSEKVLAKADIIISPSSTTVAEAAFFNKPAIQFGNLGTTLKLPNVFQHTDFTTLSSKIKEVLNIDLKTEKYEQQLENYVSAAYDVGFDCNYWGVWEKAEKTDMQELWRIYRKEIIRVINKSNEITA